MLACDAADAAGRSASFPSDKMIMPQDIAQAALLPFRMTSNACPTGELTCYHVVVCDAYCIGASCFFQHHLHLVSCQ